jgi:hypothetical protein
MNRVSENPSIPHRIAAHDDAELRPTAVTMPDANMEIGFMSGLVLLAHSLPLSRIFR